jgi:hypothetical protein
MKSMKTGYLSAFIAPLMDADRQRRNPDAPWKPPWIGRIDPILGDMRLDLP